jgi:hypothetical protein
MAYVLALDIAPVPKPFLNEATLSSASLGDLLLRNPITGIARCCARAAIGHRWRAAN